MNCAECRDNLVACAEGLLGREDRSNAMRIWKAARIAGVNINPSPACTNASSLVAWPPPRCLSSDRSCSVYFVNVKNRKGLPL